MKGGTTSDTFNLQLNVGFWFEVGFHGPGRGFGVFEAAADQNLEALCFDPGFEEGEFFEHLFLQFQVVGHLHGCFNSQLAASLLVEEAHLDSRVGSQLLIKGLLFARHENNAVLIGSLQHNHTNTGSMALDSSNTTIVFNEKAYEKK